MFVLYKDSRTSRLVEPSLGVVFPPLNVVTDYVLAVAGLLFVYTIFVILNTTRSL